MKQDALTTFIDEKSFLQAGLNVIAQICENKQGTIRIGLSGGSTPGALYKALAQEKDLPFERIEFYQVDERYVPKDHVDSNYRLISETLLKPLAQRFKAFHFFDTSLALPASLQKYEEALQVIPGNQLDLIILGIGPDGHTASLFPHSPALQEKIKLTAHTTTDQFAIHDRLTVTFPFILKSKQILVLLKGKEKQSIVDELLSSQKNIQGLPAKGLLTHPHLAIYFLN